VLETITPVIEVALAYKNIAILREDHEKAAEYFKLDMKPGSTRYLRAVQNLEGLNYYYRSLMDVGL
jgi:hypothetical protein